VRMCSGATRLPRKRTPSASPRNCRDGVPAPSRLRTGVPVPLAKGPSDARSKPWQLLQSDGSSRGARPSAAPSGDDGRRLRKPTPERLVPLATPEMAASSMIVLFPADPAEDLPACTCSSRHCIASRNRSAVANATSAPGQPRIDASAESHEYMDVALERGHRACRLLPTAFADGLPSQTIPASWRMRLSQNSLFSDEQVSHPWRVENRQSSHHAGIHPGKWEPMRPKDRLLAPHQHPPTRQAKMRQLDAGEFAAKP